VIIGGSGASAGNGRVLTDPSGSVTVDWGVLDSLGSDSRQSTATRDSKGPIVLAPPKPKPKHRPRVIAAKPKPAPAPAVVQPAPAPAEKPEPATASAAPAPKPTSAPTTLSAPAQMTSRAISPGDSMIDMPTPPVMPAAPVEAVPNVGASSAPAMSSSGAPGRQSAQQPTALVAPPPPPTTVPPPAPARSIAPPATSSLGAAPAPGDGPRAVASLPTPKAPASPAPVESTGAAVSIAFAADKSQLPSDAKARLDAVIKNMTSNDRLRAQIIAYAAGTNDNASQARRLSLSRALAVRAYLIEKGVASTRLDVRALGHQTDGGSPDRVDIALAAR
jgi:outer membrane protein OmpA-like peptidoglycan-associated protein